MPDGRRVGWLSGRPAGDQGRPAVPPPHSTNMSLGRQPLPCAVARRAGGRLRGGARRRGRPVHHRRHRCRDIGCGDRDRRGARRRVGDCRAPPPRREARPRATCPIPPPTVTRSSPSASAASTTTTTTRPVTCSDRCSPSRSAWLTRTTSRWSSTPARHGPTRSQSSTKSASRHARCSTASPVARPRPGSASIVGPTCPSPGSSPSRPPTTCAPRPRLCPLERLLVETDTPFLAPVPHRGETNRPAHVSVVGAAVASVKGVETDRIEAVTWDNTAAVFRLPA